LSQLIYSTNNPAKRTVFIYNNSSVFTNIRYLLFTVTLFINMIALDMKEASLNIGSIFFAHFINCFTGL